MKKFLIPLACVFFLTTKITSQTATDSVSLSFKGFMDVFYGYSFNSRADHQGPYFYYNHNRYNEFNLNLALVNASLEGDRYRANLGIMAGEYPQANLASEPALLKHIWQANIGVSLNKKKSLWLDAGVLPSYIGWESAVSMDNPTLTRSIAAENSPYYLAGLQLGWQISNQWKLSGIICNGWQHIRRVNGTQWPAIGTQLQFQATSAWSVVWNTFVGSDSPDSLGQTRYFSDLYVRTHLGTHLTFLGGFDIGFQSPGKNTGPYHRWYSPVIILQYANDDWALAWRGEYYSDEDGVIIPADTQTGFKTFGTSFNVDYYLSKGLLLRLEGKYLKSKASVFENKNSDFILISSLAFQFETK